MTPVFRLEYFITAAANGTPCDLEPIFNEEKYLHAIAGASVDLPMPIGRTQEYLAKLAGMDVEIPDKPIYRTEYYLAHMIDSTVECPAPIFREEMFYYEWASNEYVTISGNPVSFTAKAAPLRKLEVAFSPVQSLNGYDSPWPAGGGTNKWDEEWEAGIYSSDNGLPQPSTQNIRGKNRIAVQPSTQYYAFINTENASLKILYYDATDAYLSNEIRARQTFTTPANAAFVRFSTVNLGGTTYNHDIAINYPSSVTTYSPYSNECPISGWDSLNVEQSGKNLLFAEAFQNGLAGINIGDDIDSITPSTRYIYSYVIPARSGLSFSIKSHDLAKVNFYSVNRYVGRKLADRSLATLTDTDVHTHTYPANLYDYVRVNIGAPSGVDVNFADVDIQLELGADVTPYEAGTGRSISISLGSTVYSGYVDVVTGVLTVDYASVDMGSLSWTMPADYFRAEPSPTKKYCRTNILCSAYKVVSTASASDMPDKSIKGNDNNGRIFVKDSAYSDADTFKTAMNGVQLVYELGTPLTIQLTPQEVLALVGANNVWSDSNGDVTVTYRSN